MQTDDLILSLVSQTRPVPRHAVEGRVLLGLLAGATATTFLLLGTLGLRSDLMPAMHGLSFWMKAGYTLSIAVIAVAALLHVARPDAGRSRLLWLALVPVGVIAGVGCNELMTAPSSHWLPMWVGHSWRQCPVNVVFLSLPVFAGLLWAFRKLAPTRLHVAGAAAGLAAGATGAAVYSMHCQETTAMFLLTWYSLGILAAVVVGALVGPRLMRW